MNRPGPTISLQQDARPLPAGVLLMRALLIACIALLAPSCSHPERDLLNRADAMMEENADSALLLLSRIDREKLSGGDIPFYALLMTQAQVKADIPVASDSLIRIAYTRYVDDLRGDRGIRSNFYMGEVFFNQDKSRDAMKYYLTAYEESKRLGNDYWHAKAAERIADLFFVAFNYDEAAGYRKEAIEYYGLAGKTTNQRYAVADLATIYMNDNNQSAALSLLDSILQICNQDNSQDSFLTDYIEDTRMRAKFCEGKTIALQNNNTLSFNNTQTSRDKFEELIMISIASADKALDCNNDSILKLAQSYLSSEEDTLQLLYARYLNSDYINNKDQKLVIADSLLIMQEKLTRKMLKESIAATESDFYATIAYQQKKTSNHLFVITILAASLLVLTIIYVWRLLVLKSRLHKKDIEEKMEAISSLIMETKKLSTENKDLNSKIIDHAAHIIHLTNQIDEQDALVSGLKDKVQENEQIVSGLEKRLKYYQNDSLIHEMQSLFKDRWTTLNMLCDEYYELGDSNIARVKIFTKIEKELKNMCSNNSLKHIEAQVNRYLDNIMTRLREQCGFLKEKDFTFLMLIYAGFSVRTICIFTDIKYGSFYVRKNRLTKKISESNVSGKDEFLSGLH